MAVDNFLAFIVLALGSNLGDRLAILRRAVEGLKPFLAVDLISSVYETPAAYVTDQPAFLNLVLTATTALKPVTLLRQLKNLETELGRVPTFRYGPRMLDIDILFYDQNVQQDAELSLPHPRMAERDFVLKPLAEIAPDWRHPVTRQTAAEMLRALPDTQPVNRGTLWP